jgi:hypothetical protein
VPFFARKLRFWKNGFRFTSASARPTFISTIILDRPFRAVLAPWIARGLVTLHDWPRPVGQYSACIASEPRDLAWHLQFKATLNAQKDRTILPIMERTRVAERLAVGEGSQNEWVLCTLAFALAH